MTAKEYLSQARLLDARINAKIQQVAALNDLATHATATLTGMPSQPQPLRVPHGGSGGQDRGFAKRDQPRHR